MKKLLLTGSTGLVGSRLLDLYKNTFSIITIGRNDTDQLINLMSENDVIKAVEESDAEAVINFAAYTKVDEAEKEKMDRNGEVFIINVLLPLWLAKACKSRAKFSIIFQLITFSVVKMQDNPYTEKDTPDPVNSWYAVTKYEGEQGVINIGGKYSIVRISYPFSGVYRKKPDVARVIVDKLRKKDLYLGVTDQKIKPTSVDDIANALSFLINKDAEGIYHVAGNFFPAEFITPYKFAVEIANELGLDSSLIKEISFKEFSEKRTAPRPQHTWLDTEKIEAFGLRISPINEALKRFMNQMGNK